jgi:hypothetical protein
MRYCALVNRIVTRKERGWEVRENNLHFRARGLISRFSCRRQHRQQQKTSETCSVRSHMPIFDDDSSSSLAPSDHVISFFFFLSPHCAQECGLPVSLFFSARTASRCASASSSFICFGVCVRVCFIVLLALHLYLFFSYCFIFALLPSRTPFFVVAVIGCFCSFF